MTASLPTGDRVPFQGTPSVALGARRPMTQRAMIAALVATAALLVLHLGSSGSSALPWWQRLLGTIPGMLAVIAWARYLARRERRVPFLEYTLLQFYLFWGFPTVTYEAARGLPISTEAITAALLAISATAGMTVVGYPLGSRLGLRLTGPIGRILPRDPGRASRIIMPVWLVLSVWFVVGGVSRFPGELRQAAGTFLSYCPIFAYFFGRFSGPHDRSNNITIAVITIVASIAGFYTGMTEYIVRPIILAGMLAVSVWGILPWRVGALVAILLVVLQPVKHIYRSIAWGQEIGESESTFQIWSHAFSRAWLEDSDKIEQTTGIAERLNELQYIGATMELTPSPIPFDHGAQWKYILITPIPRVIYPSKPNLSNIFNGRYNITFGFQSEATMEGTTFGFPLVADGYWNFGWIGVAFVGAATGFLLGVLTTGIPISSWSGLSISISALLTLHATQHLAYNFASQVQNFVGTAFVCWLVRLFAGGASDKSGVVTSGSGMEGGLRL